MDLLFLLETVFQAASRLRKPASTLALMLAIAGSAAGQQPVATENSDHELIQQLLKRDAESEARIKELEAQVKDLKANQARTSSPLIASLAPSAARPPGGPPQLVKADPPNNGNPTPGDSVGAQGAEEQTSTEKDSHDHTMELPGGPALRIRGFFDINLGGSAYANPLIFPLGGTPHTTFQSGEFDLFMTSKLSDTINFLSEVIIGSDATNDWGVDIERLQLSYKPSDYFQISGGRYHTAIGYYNTAFHHGTWFQTATGRPFLFLFEDSGGILPVHSVGITTAGLVPGTGKLGLHWIAEVSNGRTSSPDRAPVQNFLSDKNHKAFNLAFYSKPDWLPGLQVGGSYYRDRLVPASLPHINQSIESAYVVYTTPVWEFLNEGIFLRHKPDGQSRVFNTAGFYTQISRKFGKYYRPYFRYQYVNVPGGDLVYPQVGRQDGPSVGMRFDFTNYAALKFQYNRLYQRGLPPGNGFDGQVAFTF